MVYVTFDDQGGAGSMTPFPSTSAGPGTHSVALKLYKSSAEISVPLKVILIPFFHAGIAVDVRIIQMFTIFIAATPPTYVRLLLKIGY